MGNEPTTVNPQSDSGKKINRSDEFSHPSPYVSNSGGYRSFCLPCYMRDTA